jgi:hypothetical protein
MSAGKFDPGRLHPGVNAPAPDEIEVEQRFPQDAKYLTEARRSGGLPDDPTTSGSPVKNRHPAKNMSGGK